MRSLHLAGGMMLVLAVICRGEPASTQPGGGLLLEGKITYAPPAGWKPAKTDGASDTAAAFIAADHDGLMMLQALPADASITPQAAQVMLRQLRTNHKKAGQEMVADPKVEKDPRFSIRILEKYKTKDGRIADELHLFRQVGPRALSLTVQSLSSDEDHIKAVHAAGEDVLLSARAANKKPDAKLPPRRTG